MAEGPAGDAADAAPLPGPPVEDIDEPPPIRPISIEDRARLILLVSSLGIFVLTIAAGFLTIWLGGDAAWGRAQELINVVLPVETLVIVGAVTY